MNTISFLFYTFVSTLVKLFKRRNNNCGIAYVANVSNLQIEDIAETLKCLVENGEMLHVERISDGRTYLTISLKAIDLYGNSIMVTRQGFHGVISVERSDESKPLLQVIACVGVRPSFQLDDFTLIDAAEEVYGYACEKN